MKYIYKELKIFIKTQKSLFAVMIFCIGLSAVILNSIVGILNDYENRIRSENSELCNLKLTFSPSSMLIKANLEQCLFELSEETTNSINMVYVIAEADGQAVQTRFTIRNGRYHTCTEFRDNMLRFQKITRYFTQEQDEEGALVALAPCNNLTELPVGMKWIFQGREYEIIGGQLWSDIPLVPFASLLDETKLDGEEGVLLEFSKAVTESQYKDITKCFKGIFGEKVMIPEIPEDWTSAGGFLASKGWIVFLFFMIAALNFAILYRFLILERQEFLAVYWLEGMNTVQIWLHYAGECLIWLTIGYWIGIGIIHAIFLPQLRMVLNYMEKVYQGAVYVKLFGIYLGVTLVLTLFYSFWGMRKILTVQILRKNR